MNYYTRSLMTMQGRGAQPQAETPAQAAERLERSIATLRTAGQDASYKQDCLDRLREAIAACERVPGLSEEAQ